MVGLLWFLTQGSAICLSAVLLSMALRKVANEIMRQAVPLGPPKGLYTTATRGQSGQVQLQPLQLRQLRPLQPPHETTVMIPDVLLIAVLLWVIAYMPVVGAAATALASVLLKASLLVAGILWEIACWLVVGAVAAGLAIALLEAVWGISHCRAMLHAQPQLCTQPLLQQDELVLHPRQMRANGPLMTINQSAAAYTTHVLPPQQQQQQQLQRQEERRRKQEAEQFQQEQQRRRQEQEYSRRRNEWEQQPSAAVYWKRPQQQEELVLPLMWTTCPPKVANNKAITISRT
eukprot:TRINITY_DN845_c0_g1_i3.p1 TRINITY_DN845_c0_g1~~TRINITY_DN845_c0_g1_i3.p1  ORF type:complete len:289 (+),score=90.03 TRINITY_DN845_c0_g1_i3:259-1125(+)